MYSPNQGVYEDLIYPGLVLINKKLLYDIYGTHF